MEQKLGEMEASDNQNTVPMRDGKRLHGGDLAAHAVEKIDTYFQLDAQMSEENKLQEGLLYGVEHGILTQDEADECLRAFHMGFISTVTLLETTIDIKTDLF